MQRHPLQKCKHAKFFIKKKGIEKLKGFLYFLYHHQHHFHYDHCIIVYQSSATNLIELSRIYVKNLANWMTEVSSSLRFHPLPAYLPTTWKAWVSFISVETYELTISEITECVYWWTEVKFFLLVSFWQTVDKVRLKLKVTSLLKNSTAPEKEEDKRLL